jgi:hypothetical protein
MWNNSVITNAGKALLASWVGEAVFSLDSAKGGTGTVAAVALVNQVALVSLKQTLSILAIETIAAGIRVKIRITAPAVGYTLNQIGLWGSIDGGASTLIALYQDETGVPIPAVADVPDFVYTYYAILEVDNTGTLTVTLDTSALASVTDVDSAIQVHNEDTEAHPDKASAVHTHTKANITDLAILSGTGTIAASASWSGPDAQGYYTYAVAANGVLAADNVDITCVKSVSDSAAAALIQTAWNYMDNVVIAANTLTFYAKTRPSVAIPIAWRVVR